ncbi:MAG: hypothetical protein ACRDUV_18490 [Pseudonocardiaceae bacterium]
MPADTPRQVQHRWCDIKGSPISLFWVEQVAENPEQGALFSRLHQRGQVVGRGNNQLYVRFPGEGQLIGLSPQLVRLLPVAPNGY